jgi:hypothetical protein
MAARLAGSLHFQRRASARRRRFVMFTTLLLLIGVAVYVGHSYMASNNTKAEAAQNVQPQQSYGAKQAQDVNLVAGAVGQFAAAYGALPHRLAVSNSSLVLCSATCDPSAYEVGGFSVYQPSDIKLVSYKTELTVPSQSTMYLVPDARCAKDGKLDGVNSDPRSMVILFATESGSTLSPRCVVL